MFGEKRVALVADPSEFVCIWASGSACVESWLENEYRHLQYLSKRRCSGRGSL